MKTNHKTTKIPELKRIKLHTIRFNRLESAAIEKYCSRYKVANKSKFMREAIINEILQKYEKDYPSLFEPKQLRLFK